VVWKRAYGVYGQAGCVRFLEYWILYGWCDKMGWLVGGSFVFGGLVGGFSLFLGMDGMGWDGVFGEMGGLVVRARL